MTEDRPQGDDPGMSGLLETARKAAELSGVTAPADRARLGLNSEALLAEAKRQREVSAILPGRVPDPTDVRLDALNHRMAELLEYEQRAAQRAELDAELGVNQDRFTRRIAVAGLVLAIVSALVGIAGVAVQLWFTLSG